MLDTNPTLRKSVHIRCYSGPYSVRLRENTDQNNSEHGHFLRSANISIFFFTCNKLVRSKVSTTIIKTYLVSCVSKLKFTLTFTRLNMLGYIQRILASFSVISFSVDGSFVTEVS